MSHKFFLFFIHFIFFSQQLFFFVRMRLMQPRRLSPNTKQKVAALQLNGIVGRKATRREPGGYDDTRIFVGLSQIFLVALERLHRHIQFSCSLSLLSPWHHHHHRHYHYHHRHQCHHRHHYRHHQHHHHHDCHCHHHHHHHQCHT